MNITLDITKRFNSIVNHDYFFDGPKMNPVLFFDPTKDVSENYCFELMNFGLNIDEQLEDEFKKNYLFFNDILHCNFLYKSLLIVGKAKITFSGIKGADMQLWNKKTNDLRYFTWPYSVEKNDYAFFCGGYSTFSEYYILFYLIGSNCAKATITFSSDDYIIMTSADFEFEKWASTKQTSFKINKSIGGEIFLQKCSHKVGKMFDYSFFSEHFQLKYTGDFNTTIAIKNESTE